MQEPIASQLTQTDAVTVDSRPQQPNSLVKLIEDAETQRSALLKIDAMQDISNTDRNARRSRSESKAFIAVRSQSLHRPIQTTPCLSPPNRVH